MSAYHIRHVDGQYQVYVTDNGRHQTDLGPRWHTPRSAAQFADTLDAAAIAPAPTTTTPTPDSKRSDTSPHNDVIDPHGPSVPAARPAPHMDDAGQSGPPVPPSRRSSTRPPGSAASHEATSRDNTPTFGF